MKITINKKEYDSLDDFVMQGRGCATTRPNHYQIKRNDERIARFRPLAPPDRLEIAIHFVHITNGLAGQIGQEQRVKQVEVLNIAFNPHRVFFTYDEDEVIYEDNLDWYNMDHGGSEERIAKESLQKDPEQFLNFYTAGIAGGLLGWATFPWEIDGDPVRDGVVILDESLPDGNAAPFNLGQTATHEIGHWLGLYHTFQGGCGGYGDHVSDTPAHSAPNFGTPEAGNPYNACEDDEFAPIHNYMNYVDDEWMSEFTELQENRIWNHLQIYRSELINE